MRLMQRVFERLHPFCLIGTTNLDLKRKENRKRIPWICRARPLHQLDFSLENILSLIINNVMTAKVFRNSIAHLSS